MTWKRAVKDNERCGAHHFYWGVISCIEQFPLVRLSLSLGRVFSALTLLTGFGHIVSTPSIVGNIRQVLLASWQEHQA